MNSSQIKNKINLAFSKASTSYDKYSETHQIIADYLLTHCPKNFPAGLILDIGAGTGILTERLRKFSDSKQIIGLDISLSMLNELASKQHNFPLVCADFDNLPFTKHAFALLASNTSLQWAGSDILDILSDNLQSNGIFAISVVIDGTFKELRRIKSELLGNANQPLPLPTFNDLKSCLTTSESLSLLRFEKHSFLCEYSSINDLLIAIKSLGIGETNQTKLNSQQLNNLKERYEEFCLKEYGRIALNYEIGFFWGRKTS